MKKALFLVLILCLAILAKAETEDTCHQRLARLITDGDSLTSAASFDHAIDKYNSAIVYAEYFCKDTSYQSSLDKKIAIATGKRKEVEDQKAAKLALYEDNDKKHVWDSTVRKTYLMVGKTVFLPHNFVAHLSQGKIESYFDPVTAGPPGTVGSLTGPFINGLQKKGPTVIDPHNNSYDAVYSSDQIHPDTRGLLDVSIIEDTSTFQVNAIFQTTDLKVLSFRGHRLNKIPDSLSKLKHLVHLDLSATNIEEIPDALFQLPELTTLYLGGNPHLRRIPKSIAALENLQALYLNGDSLLTELPADIGELKKLELLDITGTSITALPGPDKRFAHLKYLILTDEQRNKLSMASAIGSKVINAMTRVGEPRNSIYCLTFRTP